MKHTFYFLLFIAVVVLSVSFVSSLNDSTTNEVGDERAQIEVTNEQETFDPSFEGFPLYEGDQFDGEIAPVDFSGIEENDWSGATTFNNAIIEGAAKGATFAGKYTVVSVLCPEALNAKQSEEGCMISAVVDVSNGAIPLYGMLSLGEPHYQKESRLLVVNAPKLVDPNAFSRRDFSTDYYEMRNGTLTFIKKVDRNGVVFSVCPALPILARNPVTEEEKTFRTPCEVPFLWEREGGIISVEP